MLEKTSARSRRHRFLALLWLTTLGWGGLYGGVGWLLWRQGIAGWGMLHSVLFGASIVLGGVALVCWRAAFASRPQTRRRWKALRPEQIAELSPSDFEAYVADRLFAQRGYRVHNTRDTKDGGIDVLITDRLGQKAIAQCKRYSNTVGAGVVRELYGTMIHEQAAFAYLVTSGAISKDARKWAQGKPIELIDGKELEGLSK